MFGREKNSLIMILDTGAMVVKILKRNVNLSEMLNDTFRFTTEPPREQNIPIPIPRKTKLFLELASREREMPIGIQSFYLLISF